MKVLGIITARGGSKGIPNKNIKLLDGIPLINYTVATAVLSDAFDRIILSTDSEEIINVVKECSPEVDVPFVRPAELSGDTVPHLPVIQHTVDFLLNHDGYSPDAIFILQPTSPLRTVDNIRDAVSLLENHQEADSVLGVSEVPIKYNPEWVFTSKDGFLQVATGKSVKQRIRRRQDFPPAYTTTGSVYLHRIGNLYGESPSLYGDNVIPMVIPSVFSHSIDILEDWDVVVEIVRNIHSYDHNS